MLVCSSVEYDQCNAELFGSVLVPNGNKRLN